jgi:ABC-type polysaccharide/polyol phosphate transport system ATPase subunit
MAHIRLDKVNLKYPIRRSNGLFLKEFFLHGLFLKKNTLHIHALRDVSLDVREGERLGIVGCNGAGKSTILRTIGGVYPLSSGTRRVAGSICSLFDINLGLELESNGYDNIHFRSFLQGETPQSVKEKVREIAEFSELGDFLNIPIKYYSSGMLMRLAFSVATAREPEILLVDEVFGTGDLVFQKKASARMQNFLDRAKIVVMVGHDLVFLQRFCTRVIWMDQGQIRAEGPARDIIADYKRDAETRPQAA